MKMFFAEFPLLLVMALMIWLVIKWPWLLIIPAMVFVAGIVAVA